MLCHSFMASPYGAVTVEAQVTFEVPDDQEGTTMRFTATLLTLCTLLFTACGGGSGGNPQSGGGGGPSGTTAPACIMPAAGTGAGGVASGNGGLQVTTTYGTIEGTYEDGVRVFQGVRFAAPPTGCLRFRPPEEPAFTQGVTPAQAAGPHCIQIFNGSQLGDEDCLFLNVWAPNDSAAHPVMVWLHGGNINSLKGSKFAADTGIVVVAPNRRVGIFGTMALQQLADESAEHSTGTYAVQDTLAALRWVQQNIAAFGGDPARVMVNGGSAGGSVACSLFAAPAAKGLFSAASVMSGLCRPRFVVDASLSRYSSAPPLKSAHAPLIAATGCGTVTNTLDCLRNLPAPTLLDAAGKLPPLPNGGPAAPVAPVVDGVVVVSDPYSALEAQVAGSFRMVAGSTRDELRSLVTLPVMDDAAYRSYLLTTFGAGAVDALYALYPSVEYAAPTDAAYTLLSDLIFGCPAEALVRAAGKNRPAHLYLFTRGAGADGYALHGGEVPYLFDALQDAGITLDQTAMDLKSAMQSAWSALAAIPEATPLVDAGTSGQFPWPEYDSINRSMLEIGDRVSITDVYRGGRCEQLNALLPP
jgi:para-nitrobenzyl esterase